MPATLLKRNSSEVFFSRIWPTFLEYLFSEQLSMVTGHSYTYDYFCFFSEDLYLWQKTNNICTTITNKLSKTYMNSKVLLFYFPSFIVIIFLSWRVDKLEKRDVLKGVLKYHNLKSKIHLYNTYKNKHHHTIGAGTIRKKEQIQTGVM